MTRFEEFTKAAMIALMQSGSTPISEGTFPHNIRRLVTLSMAIAGEFEKEFQSRGEMSNKAAPERSATESAW